MPVLEYDTFGMRGAFLVGNTQLISVNFLSTIDHITYSTRGLRVVLGYRRDALESST